MNKLKPILFFTAIHVLNFSYSGDPIEPYKAFIPVVSAKNCIINSNESRYFPAGRFWTACAFDFNYLPPLEREPDWVIPVRTVLRVKESRSCRAFSENPRGTLAVEGHDLEIMLFQSKNLKELSGENLGPLKTENNLRIENDSTLILRQPEGAPMIFTKFEVMGHDVPHTHVIPFKKMFFRKECEAGFEITINEPDVDTKKQANEYKNRLTKEIVDWNVSLQALRSGSTYKRGIQTFAMLSRQLLEKMQSKDFLALKDLIAYTLNEARKELKNSGTSPLSKNTIAILSKILEALSNATNAGTLKIIRLEDLLTPDERHLLADVEQDAEYDETENRIYMHVVSSFYQSVRRARIAQAQLKDFIDPRSWPIVGDEPSRNQELGEIK